MLSEDDMTIDKILAKARALENSKKQAKGMEDSAAQSTATLSETARQSALSKSVSQSYTAKVINSMSAV